MQHRAWRESLYEIIFKSETPAGKAFDVVLIITILASVLVVMLESMQSVNQHYGEWLRAAEWVFTVLFTVEYVLRLASARRPGRYARSFFGIVDLVAVVPTYLSVLLPGAQYLLIVRLLRVLRVFRVLKLATYMGEANLLMRAMRASRRKITVFLFAVLTVVTIMGALMYLIEGAEHGFTSIPRSVYWAIVTLTTVGFGDISPQTGWGQALAALLMIMGFGIIAVPTGIVTTEISRAEVGRAQGRDGRRCPACHRPGHDDDASHCKYCGTALSSS